MAAAALVFALLAASLLALPLLVHLSLDVAGSLLAPVAGGLAVVALVLGGWSWRSRRRQATPVGGARAAVILAAASVCSAVAVERALIVRDRAAAAERARRQSTPRAPDDKQFDDALQDNLNR